MFQSLGTGLNGVGVIARKLAEAMGTDEFLKNGFFTVLFLPDNWKGMNVVESGILSGGFVSVTMPEITLNYQEIRQANRRTPIYLPTDEELGTVTMTRGVTFLGSPLYKWVIKYREFGYDPKDIAIVRLNLMGGAYLPAQVTVLVDAQPTRYKLGGDMEGLSSDVSIEELEVNFSDLIHYDLSPLGAVP